MPRVLELRFQDSDDAPALPDSVVVRLTGREALFLAALTGAQSGTAAEGVMPGGSPLVEGIYDVLSGDVFNRIYDDGVDGALEEVRHAARA